MKGTNLKGTNREETLQTSLPHCPFCGAKPWEELQGRFSSMVCCSSHPSLCPIGRQEMTIEKWKIRPHESR
jgi:hypothetical protein